MALAADRSVRLASAADTPAMAVVQRDAWRSLYATVLPAQVLDSLDPVELAESWRQAVVTPPGPTYRVLVALADGEVVGFLAAGSSPDPDLEPGTDAEISALLVRPDHPREGHGSRLLQAAIDTLRPLDVRYAYLWLGAADAPLRALVESAGWQPDGATRELDLLGDGSTVVTQERLHARIDLPGAELPHHEDDHG